MFCYFCVFSFDFLVFFFNDCSSLAFLTWEIWRLVHSVTCIYRIIMQVILNLTFSIVWCKVLWPSIIYLIDNGKICLRKVSMLFWSTFVLTGRGFPILESECPHFLDCGVVMKGTQVLLVPCVCPWWSTRLDRPPSLVRSWGSHVYKGFEVIHELLLLLSLIETYFYSE